VSMALKKPPRTRQHRMQHRPPRARRRLRGHGDGAAAASRACGDFPGAKPSGFVGDVGGDEEDDATDAAAASRACGSSRGVGQGNTARLKPAAASTEKVAATSTAATTKMVRKLAAARATAVVNRLSRARRGRRCPRRRRPRWRR
jgi:hypothetical protein